MWFLKRLAWTRTEQHKDADKDSYTLDDFLHGKGLTGTELRIVLTETPKVSYELWTHRQKRSSKSRSVTGSYVLNLEGKVKRAFQALVLQEMACVIRMSEPSGGWGEDEVCPGRIGSVIVKKGYLDIEINTKGEYVRDLVVLLGLYGLSRYNLLRIRLDVEYERKLKIEEARGFDIVRIFVWWDEKGNEVNPWNPQDP